MQSYFFDLVEGGDVHIDEYGSELISREDARLLARSLLADVARDALLRDAFLEFACEVRDHRRHLVYRGEFTFSEKHPGAPS